DRLPRERRRVLAVRGGLLELFQRFLHFHPRVAHRGGKLRRHQRVLPRRLLEPLDHLVHALLECCLLAPYVGPGVTPLHPLRQLLLPTRELGGLGERVVHLSHHFSLPGHPHVVAALSELLRQRVEVLAGLLTLAPCFVDVLFLGLVGGLLHVVRRLL